MCETNINGLPLARLPAGDLAHSLAMCSDCESKRQPFCPQVGAQSTEPHQPGPNNSFKIHEAELIELKGDTDKSTIRAGD